jgi:hypothetical protein
MAVRKKPVLANPTRWSPVVGARIQRYNTRREAEEARAAAEERGERSYIFAAGAGGLSDRLWVPRFLTEKVPDTTRPPS